jgi:recA bacterial DNA recombination protein
VLPEISRFEEFMSSAVVSTSAALSRPFVFDEDSEGLVGTAALGSLVERSSTTRRQHLQSTINNSKISPSSITTASRLEIRPTPEMVSSGIAALDALTGGLPRGCVTEICGPASSGRTTLLLATLAAATRRGEYCALVDASDVLDPLSAAATGANLDRLLWVRCNNQAPQKRSVQKSRDREREFQSRFKFDSASSRPSEHRLEQVLRATDLLLESGGFGLIILDLADLPPQTARRIPLTTWFRFRRAIEHTPTMLVAIEQHPIAGSCSSLLLELESRDNPEETRLRKGANLSCVAAEYESRARQCRVSMKEKNESRRDGAPSIEQPATTIAMFPTHAHLLTGLNIHAELICSRLERKPARSVTFATKTAWAG